MYKPADIVRVSELSGVVEGGEARLTCEAEGFPRPKIYWTREEKGHFITIRDRHSSKSREGKTLILSYLFSVSILPLPNDFTFIVSWNFIARLETT